MIETMMVDRVIHAAETGAESSCRRQVLPIKAEGKKAGNLRRIRMELRKMRSVAKERTFGVGDDSSGSDCPKKKKRCQNLDKDDFVADDVAKNNVGSDRGALTHGKISVIGRRREMEDAVAVELDFMRRGRKSYDFYGVYDGHGGWRVAEECSELMHKKILGELENVGELINWDKLMVEGFRKMDEEVNKKGAAVATTGSTAVVAVVDEEEVVVANCGDSRAVLCRDGAALPLSDDHKPDRADELERIEDCGGKVINWNGQRVLGVLATSRSIGDQYLKPFVITEPEVKVIKRTDSDEFLILASDGLWDVVSNDLACQVTRRCLDGRIRRSSFSGGDDDPSHDNVSEAAAVLAEVAMARGSRDNISVVVVELRRSPSCQGASSSCSSSR